jgi:signal transduction histidine kinase
MNSGHNGATVPFAKSSVFRSHRETRCQHEVQFYFDDQFLIQSLAGWVQCALDGGGSAIIVATEAHRVRLAQELRRDRIALTSFIDQGRYVALDAAETLAQFMVDNAPDVKRFRQVIGDVISCAACVAPREYGKVAIFGEMVALLWQRGEVQAALRLEQMWNELSEHYSFQLRCAYPITSFDQDTHTELFNRICAEHNFTIPAESYSESSDPQDRLRTVAFLQQTEQVLKTEAVGRRVAEAQKEQAQRQNERLTEEIRKHEAVEEELRKFTRRLLTTRDEEQRRIALELHENTAQLLAALSLYFGIVHQEKDSLNPRLARAIASSRSVSDNLLSEIRKLSHLLHPPTLDEMGVASAVKEYIEEFVKSSGARVDLKVGDNIGRFDRNLEITVFRIVEEALANVHSRSREVSTVVRLSRSSATLLIEIESHHPAKGGNESGSRQESRFTGIHERVMEHGGSMHFASSPSGTRVAVKLPLRENGHHQRSAA